MSYDSHMWEFREQQERDYPNHIKVGDRVGRYVERTQLSGNYWELREVGWVKYVGPGYARVEFMTRVNPINIPLNSIAGNINESIRINGCKFRGPIRSNTDNGG